VVVDGDGDGDEMAQPGGNSAMLSFQLDVYIRNRVSRPFDGACAELAQGHGGLAEQLRPAALSIPLNMGSGRSDIGSRRRLDTIAFARGSAMEFGAIVDGLNILSDLEDAKREQACDLLGRIVAKLTKLCR